MELTWNIDGINLPQDPSTIQDKASGDVQAIRSPGALPIMISFGSQARILAIDGFIYQKGLSKSQLETTYVTPLRNKMATVCNITSTDGTYDGLDDWIMIKCDMMSEPAGPLYYKYRMEFKLGSEANIISI